MLDFFRKGNLKKKVIILLTGTFILASSLGNAYASSIGQQNIIKDPKKIQQVENGRYNCNINIVDDHTVIISSNPAPSESSARDTVVGAAMELFGSDYKNNFLDKKFTSQRDNNGKFVITAIISNKDASEKIKAQGPNNSQDLKKVEAILNPTIRGKIIELLSSNIESETFENETDKNLFIAEFGKELSILQLYSDAISLKSLYSQNNDSFKTQSSKFFKTLDKVEGFMDKAEFNRLKTAFGNFIVGSGDILLDIESSEISINEGKFNINLKYKLDYGSNTHKASLNQISGRYS